MPIAGELSRSMLRPPLLLLACHSPPRQPRLQPSKMGGCAAGGAASSAALRLGGIQKVLMLVRHTQEHLRCLQKPQAAGARRERASLLLGCLSSLTQS